MDEATAVISNISTDTSMWLGVAKDSTHYPDFYLIRLLGVEIAADRDENEIMIQFSSDDNINDILKTVRANEVWGKPVDFLLLALGEGLFSRCKIVKLCECVITNVSKNGAAHTWVIKFLRVTVTYK